MPRYADGGASRHAVPAGQLHFLQWLSPSVSRVYSSGAGATEGAKENSDGDIIDNIIAVFMAHAEMLSQPAKGDPKSSGAGTRIREKVEFARVYHSIKTCTITNRKN